MTLEDILGHILNIFGVVVVIVVAALLCWTLLYFYLSKFKVVQEILGKNETSSSVEQLRNARTNQTRKIIRRD
ncbi:hypothetical protein Anas_06746 [Armadillidium nasatum]|uniref:Small integral membrane protein 13 n=1 Tax=Armadillidium nasatum TaxID=96803 RepID=A0A5N5SX44_9CRUS|nr:hypothetical protein Anas_06746 [Armadillidium nasatum]